MSQNRRMKQVMSHDITPLLRSLGPVGIGINSGACVVTQVPCDPAWGIPSTVDVGDAAVSLKVSPSGTQ